MGTLFARVAVAGLPFVADRVFDYTLPSELEGSVQPGMRVLVPFGRGNRRTEAFVLSLTDVQPAVKTKNVLESLDGSPVLDESLIRLALWMRGRFFCSFFEAARAMLPAGLWYVAEDLLVLRPDVPSENVRAAAGNQEIGVLLVEELLKSKTVHIKSWEGVLPSKILTAVVTRLIETGVAERRRAVSRKVGDQFVWCAVSVLSGEEARFCAVAEGKRSPGRRAVLEMLADSSEMPAEELCTMAGASMRVLRAMEKAGLLVLERREGYRTPSLGENSVSAGAVPVSFTSRQTEIFQRLCALLHGRIAVSALLHGVTGSGKTLVYLELAETASAAGGGCLILVPEIALTAQLMSLFVARFGGRVAVLHSGLSTGQRYDEWKRVKRGEASVVLGTRSAVFAPVQNLRLLIMDEEQERTYKSDASPRYHARDVARWRAVNGKALLVLGSATPSVESMKAARDGAIELLSLTDRYNNRPLPDVLFADMRAELRAGNGTSVSRLLADEIGRTVGRGEQVILFMGRRGYSRQMMCGGCGFVPSCTRCSVSLTCHRGRYGKGRMLCHYCGHSEREPEVCPICEAEMLSVGTGIQRVEEDLGRIFPGMGVLRMDADTTTAQGSHASILRRFRALNVPVLLGTQMVTKGLDFPEVTLVGVLSADQCLYTGSMRGRERAFSLITQVVGRAGRGVKPGRAVVQTFSPGHPVLAAAAAQDYDAFYQGEIGLRSACGAPPFADWVVITVLGIDEDDVLHGCLRFRSIAEYALQGEYSTLNASLYGPAPAYVVRVNNQFRYRVMLCGPPGKALRALTARLLFAFASDKRNRGLTVFADVNPDDA